MRIAPALSTIKVFHGLEYAGGLAQTTYAHLSSVCTDIVLEETITNKSLWHSIKYSLSALKINMRKCIHQFSFLKFP